MELTLDLRRPVRGSQSAALVPRTIEEGSTHPIGPGVGPLGPPRGKSLFEVRWRPTRMDRTVCRRPNDGARTTVRGIGDCRSVQLTGPAVGDSRSKDFDNCSATV